MNFGRAVLLALLGLALAGCGGGDGGESASGNGSAETGTSIKRRTAGSLPKVGDYLPPLDDGRIEIAAPADWKPLPRQPSFVAGFYKTKVSELPRITVLSEEPPADAAGDTTEENVDALAAQLAKQLPREQKTVQEPPKPIILGDTVFARHVRLAKFSGSPAVIQSLQTIRGGRMYSVEMIAEVEASRADEYEASLKRWRDIGYAVAANLKFSGGAPAAEPQPPPETTAPQAAAPE